MSWTLSQEVANDETLRTKFKNAVQEAEKHHILMLGATMDQGRNTRNSTFPSKELSEIICIGGAGLQGEDDTASQEDSEFTFPKGNLGKIHPTKPGNEEVSGSSVATALAAGLAALVLHCAELTKCKSGRTTLRSKEKMSKTFRAMTEKDDGTRQSRYVAAQNYFKPHFENFSTADGLYKLGDVLRDLKLYVLGSNLHHRNSIFSQTSLSFTC